MNAPHSGRVVAFRLSRGQLVVGLLLLVALSAYAYSWISYPSDRTPEGAYLRVVRAVNEGKPELFFAYTEEAAQHACYTIGDYRKKMLAAAQKDYPPARYEALVKEYGNFAKAPDGADVFSLMARRHGWLSQLRLDVSGIAKVEKDGPRATIQTAKGTRYSMRVRPNGIWGLTAFTPALVEEAEKAARDLEQVKKAAADFARVRLKDQNPE